MNRHAWAGRLSLLVLAFAACAAPDAGGGTHTIPASGTAFSDTAPLYKTNAWQQILAGEKGLCRAPGKRPHLPFARADAGLHALMSSKLGRTRLGRLMHKKSLRTPTGAEAGAAAAFAVSSPGTAAVALLAAHQDQPRDPMPLISASVALVNAGRAEDALSFLDAADAHLRPGQLGPMHLKLKAISLNNRGYALIALGRAREAIGPLQRAIALEPLLSEARRNLGAARFCAGQRAAGAGSFQKGQRRHQLQDLPGETYPDPADAFDLSKGVPGSLPDIAYPKSPAEGVARADSFDSASKQHYNTAETDLAESTKVKIAPHSSVAQGVRDAAIISASGPFATPALKALWDQLAPLNQQQLDFISAFSDQISAKDAACNYDETCFSNWCLPATASEHDIWFAGIVHYDGVTREWASAYYKLASGLAENVSDPGQAQAILLNARWWIEQRVSILLGAAYDWMFLEQLNEKDCVTRPDAPQDAETAPGNLPGVSVCPPTIDAIRFALKWIFPGVAKSFQLEVRVRCDNVQVDEGPGADVRNIVLGKAPTFRKTATVFVGKAGGSWRSGSYVTFGEENHSGKPVVTDAGETNHDEGHGLDVWGNAAHDVVAGSVY